jgi:Carboxypeptidase regulatory-like domain
MKPCMLRFLALAIFLAASVSASFGQSGATAPLSGLVLDQSGAVVSGAVVVVKNNATGAEFTVTTATNGTYTVPALGAALYTVTVEAAGFKKVVLQGVKIDVGVPATANVTLEIGERSESVVVQGAGEVLQTQTANITTTLQTKQIAELPLQSRNSIYFLTMLPGVSSAATASPRNSTINGLPSSAYNVTIDGLNTQDNFGKNGDGFFSYIAPSLDAIQEVTLSTATPGAESSGQGAIQIKFATRQGGNELHGSLYEYHRNTALNSNYWYTNRDTSYNLEAAKPCGDPSSSSFNKTTMVPWSPDCRAPRARNLFNQYGGRVGGPIVIPKLFNGRDRAFFFVNYEEFRQPNSVSRTRMVLTPDAQRGIFKYAGGPAAGVNLLDLAASKGQLATIDPTIQKLLADIRNSTSSTGGITPNNNLNLQNFTFNNSSMGVRYFPTVRIDINLSSKHRLENTYNYQSYVTSVDTLNNRDPQFPGFPNHAGQFSNRFADSVALRSTLIPTLVNEARVGFDGGTVLFFPDANAGQFTGTLANQAGFNLGGNPGNNATGIAVLGIHGPTNTTAPSRRNSPVWDVAETLSWTRGAHSFSFGGQFTQINTWLYDQTLVPTINFGLITNEPALDMFNVTNFPGGDSVLGDARNLYAILTGRVTSITGNAVLDEKTGQYQYLGAQIRRFRMREYGLFAQDSWRARPNLTLTGGLRYELQLPFETLNGVYNTTTADGLYGVSGPGGVFNPNAKAGSVTQFVPLNKGDRAYKTDLNNIAPSIGFAWSLNAQEGWLKRIIGEGGQTVLRGGYSIAYNRQGGASFSNVFDNNPGLNVSATRSATNGNLAPATELPVLLSQTGRLGPAPFSTTPSNPLIAGVRDPVTGRRDITIGSSANIFEANIQTPYNQSFTLGIQRELSKDMAIEVRYVHTRNLQQWVTYDLNEVNIVENGFLNEFKNAQRNLAICQANAAACLQAQTTVPSANRTVNNFGYWGLPGQSPLPIYLAYFSGLAGANVTDPTKYNSGNFRSPNFLAPLAPTNPQPYTTASTSATNGLFGSQTFRDNAVKANLLPNFFVVNPDLLGGVNFTGNGGYSRYDGMQVDFRRRLSRGLLIEANYTWAKSYTGLRNSFRTQRVNGIFTTNGGTLAHAFKANWVYELPVGKGKMFLGNPSGFGGGLLERILGGWEWNGTARIQTGANLDLGNVNLVGMTREDLQKAYQLRFDDAGGKVYIFPQDIIDNTIKAFNVSATTTTGYAGNNVPTGRYIAPANSRNCVQVVEGDCGFTNLFITGPKFVRFDLSLIKRIRIKEGMNFELRGEFLNAFNNINYLGNTNLTLSNTNAANNSNFGLVTTSYRDVNNTQDPGGRLIQIVGRFNF